MLAFFELVSENHLESFMLYVGKSLQKNLSYPPDIHTYVFQTILRTYYMNDMIPF